MGFVGMEQNSLHHGLSAGSKAASKQFFKERRKNRSHTETSGGESLPHFKPKAWRTIKLRRSKLTKTKKRETKKRRDKPVREQEMKKLIKEQWKQQQEMQHQVSWLREGRKIVKIGKLIQTMMLQIMEKKRTDNEILGVTVSTTMLPPSE